MRKYAGASNFERIKLEDYPLDCEDFKRFKDELGELRKPEDNIKYRLARTASRHVANTERTDCGDLWDALSRLREYRGKAIERCMAHTKNAESDDELMQRMKVSLYRTEVSNEQINLRTLHDSFKEYCGSKGPWAK